MKRLRFALLFNGNSLERWHLRCLDHLEEVAQLAGTIVTPDQPSPRSRSTGSILMRSYARRVRDASTMDVTKRFAHVPRIFADRVDALLEPSAFDFVLKLGPGPMPAEIERATRHGVWYFEHEGGTDLLPFLREVYDNEPVTRAALMAFRPAPSEAVILEEGYFRTEKRSYIANRDRLLDCIAAWPARVCGRVEAGVVGDSARRATDGIQLPSAHEHSPQLLRFWAGITRRRFQLAWERLFRHPQWNIGVLDVPVGTLLAPGAYADGGIEWFPLDDRKSFLADPFGIVRDGVLHVLCERFEYRDSKGHICTVSRSSGGFTRQPERAITLPVHTSYPFLIEDSGEIYCIPETCEANEVALFRAVVFPHRWEKFAVLVEQFAGLDPTVFRHGDRWWLTCTEKGPAEDAELCVWYASDLLGPWTAHARNPVKTDVRSARPGGSPFVHEGALYRPAQDCSMTYGWRIAIQRVVRLTPTEFAEEPVTVLEASADSPFPDGRHTLTPVGDVVLVDGRRSVFAWPALRAFLRVWASELAGKGGRG